MRIALLGADDEALSLLIALLDAGHELVAHFDAAEFQPELAQIAPHARRDDDWESLLLSEAVDCVLVAHKQSDHSAVTGISASERREEQLRKLAQSGSAALVAHPACEAIVGFEVDMICRDSHATFLPYVPGLLNPGLEKIAALIDAGEASPIGRVEQITFERFQADRSRAAVLPQFARDAALLRTLLGEIRKLNATGPIGPSQVDPLGPKPKTRPSLTNLSVHLTGEREFGARWSIAPEIQDPRGMLTLIGSRGRATLTMPVDARPWTLTQSAAENSVWTADPAWREPAIWAERLASMIDGTSPPPLAWIDACRASEATAAIDRSLERGRTIELYNEEHTEEESFKGVMAVGGCLLLSLALMVLFVATMVEGLHLPLRDAPFWRLWPVYLVIPIVVFLVMQLLQVVVKRDPPQSSEIHAKSLPND
jgi:predicted dehydrogenase